MNALSGSGSMDVSRVSRSFFRTGLLNSFDGLSGSRNFSGRSGAGGNVFLPFPLVFIGSDGHGSSSSVPVYTDGASVVSPGKSFPLSSGFALNEL